jgi:hypothetical protein
MQGGEAMGWDSVQSGGRAFFNPVESAAYQQRLTMRNDVLCNQALMPIAQPSMEQVMGLMGYYNGCLGSIQQLRYGSSLPDMSMMMMQNPQMMMFFMMYQQMQMQNMMLMMMILQNNQLAMLQALAQTGCQNPSQGGRSCDPGVTGKAPPGCDGNVNLSPHGGWEGTQGPIQDLTEIAGSGVHVTSAKRNNMYTTSGNVSDHFSGKPDAYAHDLSWNSSRPTAESDAAASRIVSALGGPPNWGSDGGVFNKTMNGIRYQVVYKSMVGGNHYNHIHVGAHRV